MTQVRLTTADELYWMGSDARYILVHGRLIEEIPSGIESSQIGGLILTALNIYVRPRKLGQVFGEAAGFILSRDPDTVVAPDASFLLTAHLPPSELRRKVSPRPPDLAVEVLSASDRRGDIQQKIELYREANVPLLWVIDPDARTATVYQPGRPPVLLREDDALDGADVLPGFTLPLAELFAP